MQQNKVIHSLIIVVLMVSSWTSQAQDTMVKELSLEEAIEKALANNDQIKQVGYDYEIAQTELSGIKTYHLPQIDAYITGSATNLPLYAFGNSLQQGIIEQSDFIPSALNNPSVVGNLQSQVSFKQPLMNLDVRPMKAAMEATSNAYELQMVRYKTVISAQVAQSYLQLQLTQKALEVLEETKKTVEANLKLTKDNVEEGYLQKVDELSVELRLSEVNYQILETKNNLQNISDQLSYLMGEPSGTLLIPSQSLIEEDHSSILSNELSGARSDFNAMEQQIAAQQKMIEAVQKNKLPRINAFGSYEVNNPFDFQDAQHGFLLGIQASINIFDGLKNKTTIQKNKIEVIKNEVSLADLIAQNEIELAHSKRQLTAAQDKINLAKTAIEQSKEALRIKMDRYAEGLEKTTDILNAETVLYHKEMGYIQALYEYHLAYSQINMLLELPQ
ncbi:MAG: TolC family protein [Bacteroidetes bacterium]|nr:TolC family protein [Bacteroidota bacterium]